jgi:hypothetical protein
LDWQIISSLAAALGTVIAAIALYQSIRIHSKQSELNKSIHDQQTLLARRQLLLPLWGYLNDLADINPLKPVWEDVRKAANILELVSICWEGQMIDEFVMRRFFSMTFIETYDKINRCVNPPENFPYDGPAILRSSPATIRLYEMLKREYAEQGAISPLTQSRSR